jgi:hypothetical protein
MAHKTSSLSTSADLDLATQWFDRIDTTTQIRDAMKKRFAYGIVKNSDGYETYKRGEMTAEIDAGLYEAIDVGIGQRILSALAQLFTRPGSGVAVMTESGDVDVDSTARLQDERKAGRADVALVAADRIASAVESSFIRVIGNGESGLLYEAIAPQNVHILFPAYIETRTGEERAPDESNIQDAAAIVVRLSAPADATGQCRWIAYIGACEEYPLGRCCSFSGSADSWSQIPEVGTPGCRDVYEGEEVCNPLSLLKYAGGTMYFGPEYPLVVVRGGHVSGQVHPAPTITSLYESCMELTLAWSRVLKDSLSGMLGREVLKNPDASPLPEVTEGLIALKRGQEFEVKTMNSGSVTAAVDAVYAASGAVAAGWNVPPYTVVSRVGSTPESGVALVIQTAPLVQFLDHRDMVNGGIMESLYDIESGLILYHTGVEQLPLSAPIMWSPGRVRVPQDSASLTQAVVAQLDAGLIDAVEAVRILSDLGTAAEAEAALTERKERAARVGKIQTAAAPTRPVLPPRGAGR